MDLSTIDKQINEIPLYFSTDEVALYGGLAVYLQTQQYRPTSDVDLLILKPSNQLFQKIHDYSHQIGIRVDTSPRDKAFGTLDLSSDKSIETSTTIKELPTGLLRCLFPEAIIISKLTSLQISGERYQPTQYGITILRDKDLRDICDLMHQNNDVMLMKKVLEYNPYLVNDGVDMLSFLDISLKVIKDKNLPSYIRQNAYGIGRLASLIPRKSQTLFSEAIEKGLELKNAGMFALWLAEDGTNKIFQD